ncbi:hypothetical protein QE424_000196 [Stenotrophomonas rhizophila]|jgi:hypothetical protein|uniref:Uncharacterized protein n=2 Tax=Stenotrophomonas rhizophila TaxID=216778 RepID=A0AAP5ADU0_9GAMM|nr:hypothetical protein [Stenotrophomonas rhizophila]
MVEEPQSKEGVRESLRPKLRLFMSADIVGSTAFKQRPGHEFNHQWFSIVRSFYTVAERFFELRWAQMINEFRESECVRNMGQETPALWKTIGDEVLFTKDIADPREALICMSVWLRVLDDLRDLLKKAGSLDLKSSAWLADFPIRNREILLRATSANQVTGVADKRQAELPSDATAAIEEEEDFEWENDRLFEDFKKNSPDVSRDFVGQSIDTGFRVGTAATSRKLMLSVELAHMLSLECARVKAGPERIPKFPISKFRFHFDGRHSLKGVLDGTPYPLLWLDVEPDRLIHSTEDILSARPKPTPGQIHEFTSALINDFPNRFCTMLEFLAHKPSAYQKYEDTIEKAIGELHARFSEREKSLTIGKESAQTLEDGTPKHVLNINALMKWALARATNPVAVPPAVPAAVVKKTVKRFSPKRVSASKRAKADKTVKPAKATTTSSTANVALARDSTTSDSLAKPEKSGSGITGKRAKESNPSRTASKRPAKRQTKPKGTND